MAQENVLRNPPMQSSDVAPVQKQTAQTRPLALDAVWIAINDERRTKEEDWNEMVIVEIWALRTAIEHQERL
jgi:hypothetical protein